MKIELNLAEAIANWKTGNIPVWSASLGGLGPSYEQCIQVLLWETLARWNSELPPVEEGKKYPEVFEQHFKKVVDELDVKFQFSGAQVGAAKVVAFQFLAYGYGTMMAKLPDDRWIQVMRDFPSLEATNG